MKRRGGQMRELCDPCNVILADMKARKGKKGSKTYIEKHDENLVEEDLKLAEDLFLGNFKTSPYRVFKIYEPKEREIYRLPYYPDRIVQHALIRVLKDYWTSLFIPNTYSCIEGRGIHKCVKDLKRDLKNHVDETVYCLKMDIRKFYPFIDHEVLKSICKWKIKDKRLLDILHGIIDSVPTGVPIGNYLSQYFANLYLTPFDIWCKQELGCKYYYRYADDIVILGNGKERLHNVLVAIKLYMKYVLKLELKGNYQVFPVEARGIDFVGYVFKHNHTKLRKSIKERMRRKLLKLERLNSPTRELVKSRTKASYKGWLAWGNCRHLGKKYDIAA